MAAILGQIGIIPLMQMIYAATPTLKIGMTATGLILLYQLLHIGIVDQKMGLDPTIKNSF